MPGFADGSLNLVGVLLLTLSALTILISGSWRLQTLALFFQYVGVFILVSSVWPTPIALIKLVAGWVSALVLGLAMAGSPPETDMTLQPAVKIVLRSWSIPLYPISRSLFRLLAAFLVLLVVFSISTRIADWTPGIGAEHALGAFILIGMGLLHLGLTTRPFRTIVSLLIILAGFEIIYAAVEISTLVAGLLAILNLGLALVGAYLIIPETREEAA